MGIFDFKRCDGFVGSIPQKFIDTNSNFALEAC